MLATGAGIGLLFSLGLGRSVGARLFGLKAYDAGTLIFAAALLRMVPMLASWIPRGEGRSHDRIKAGVRGGILPFRFSTEFKSFQHLRNISARDSIHLVVTKFASNAALLSAGASELRSPIECAKLRSVE